MITKITEIFGGDMSQMLQGSSSHILFPISKEGKRGDKEGEGADDQECVNILDCHFSIKLSDGTPLPRRGHKNLGEVIIHKSYGKTFHALVCYSRYEEGWENSPKIIKEYLNSINLGENLCFVMDNDETELKFGGTNLLEILKVIADSDHKVEIYLL